MSWLIPFPSSSALNAARANTCQEYYRDGFSLWLPGGTAMLGWFRHTLGGPEGRREAKPGNVIPRAHAGLNRGKEPYWGWYWKLQKTNKRNKIFPTLALWKPCTSFRVQPDRSLLFALSRIYLDLLHLHQEDSVCRISLLATKTSCFSVPFTACASGLNAPSKSSISQN